MNIKSIAIMLLSSALAVGAAGTTNQLTFFPRYKAVLNDSSVDQPTRAMRAQEYLQSLNQREFMAFLKETTRLPEFPKEGEGATVIMTVFAMTYMKGPGTNEPLAEILKQFHDSELPIAWKAGLLDVLRLQRRENVTEAETAAALSAMHEIGGDVKAPDAYRYKALGELGSFLRTQRRLIVSKAPELQSALDRQDLIALSKTDDPTSKQAVRLVGWIQDYRAALDKAASEVKDVQLKAGLKERSANWAPASAAPSK